MKMTMQGRTFEMGAKIINLYPDKTRAEISIMGMKMERITNGKKGVSKRMGQEQSISEEEIEKEKFGDIYDIFHSKDKYKFQYLQEQEIEGKKYDLIYIFDAKKNWIKFFINKETSLVEIEETLTKLPGQAGIQRTVKSDFKTIKGIPFSFKSETFIKDKKVFEMTVNEIKVNPKVDPSIFKIEEKK
jgi:hypothetical protein